MEAPAKSTLATTASALRKRLKTTTRQALSTTASARRVPTLISQARSLARDTPRLPEAAGTHGVATTIGLTPTRAAQLAAADPESPHAFHVVVLGDSVAAGVGLDHHRNSVAGRLASLLSERCGHPVAWHVIARSGADARTCERLTHDSSTEERLANCDAVLVSVGVNDVLATHTSTRWRRDLRSMLDRIVTLNPTAPVLLLGVPPLDIFPAMPTELGRVLGRRSRHFDDIGRDLATSYPTVHHLALDDAGLSPEKAFAKDGFHPSPKMHKRIAKRADKIMARARENAGNPAPEADAHVA